MNEQHTEPKSRRSCFSYGCMGAAVVFLLFVGWIAAGFVVWKQSIIPLPDGSGSVVYMARLNKIVCAEWDRKIRVEVKGNDGKARLIPGDSCGGSPVNVYWYPEHLGKGPYLRFKDPLWEYLLDVKQGTASLLVRLSNGEAYTGEMLSTHTGYLITGPDTVDGKLVENSVDVEVDGRSANKLDSFVASNPGVYIGRINETYRGFTSKKEAPEEVLPQH